MSEFLLEAIAQLSHAQTATTALGADCSATVALLNQTLSQSNSFAAFFAPVVAHPHNNPAPISRNIKVAEQAFQTCSQNLTRAQQVSDWLKDALPAMGERNAQLDDTESKLAAACRELATVRATLATRSALLAEAVGAAQLAKARLAAANAQPSTPTSVSLTQLQEQVQLQQTQMGAVTTAKAAVEARLAEATAANADLEIRLAAAISPLAGASTAAVSGLSEVVV